MGAEPSRGCEGRAKLSKKVAVNLASVDLPNGDLLELEKQLDHYDAVYCAGGSGP